MSGGRIPAVISGGITEDRVREIVREELAAVQAELAHDRVPRGVGKAGASLGLFKPVLESDDAGGQRGSDLPNELLELFEGYAALILTDGVQGGQQIQNAVSSWHRRRDVVQQGPDSVSGFVGAGGNHGASPSLGLDPRSVGDGAAPGDELRAHTSGAAHPEGGGR